MNEKVVKTLYSIAALLMLLGLPGFSIAQDKLWRNFKKPPLQYRPIPFWHLNGALTTNGIKKQVSDAGKNGFGGVAVLPVTAGPQFPTNLPAPGMSPAYLSNAYFARYSDILKAAKSNRLNVILYDDLDFPSGTAGGKLQKQFPELTRKVLDKTDTVLNGGSVIKLKLPAGVLMAVIAKDMATGHRTDLTGFVKNSELSWPAPQGKWQISVFNCRLNADAVVDYMDPVAVNKFIGFTYHEYAGRFGSYFGNVIKQTFFDDVGYVAMERGWTTAFNEKFKQLFGKNPALYYPALWENIGPETEAARVAFFDTRAELLAEGFPKIVSNWDSKHGLKSSGHPPGNYEIQPVDMSFDIFKFYRHEHIPTMDAIFYHGHGREGFKLVSSAAAVYDRPVVASETYGAFQENNFDVKMLYQTAMEIFVRGINFLVPHGMWYDPKPQSVRIPPLISPYSKKIGPELKRYNDFAARTSMLLQGGKQVSEIGVIYPIASLEGFYHFQAKDNPGVGKYVSPGTDYLQLSDMLTNQVRHDFTFIHPQLFAGDQYIIYNSQVILKNKVNEQNYKVMILPGGKVISYCTLKKLKQFYDEGGKIIATTLLPSKSAEFGKDSLVTELVKEIFADKASNYTKTNTQGGVSLFIPRPDANGISEALNKMDKHPDIIFENNAAPNSGNGAFSYLHKINNGRNVYYFANSTTDSIDTFIDIRGRMLPEFWDPASGNKSAVKGIEYKKINSQIYTRLKLNIPPVKSVFIVSKLNKQVNTN